MRIYPPVNAEELFAWLKAPTEAETGEALSPRQAETFPCRSAGGVPQPVK